MPRALITSACMYTQWQGRKSLAIYPYSQQKRKEFNSIIANGCTDIAFIRLLGKNHLQNLPGPLHSEFLSSKVIKDFQNRDSKQVQGPFEHGDLWGCIGCPAMKPNLATSHSPFLKFPKGRVMLHSCIPFQHIKGCIWSCFT